MKKNELYGLMLLIVGIMLAFSLTACDDGGGNNGGNTGGNTGGGSNAVITLESNAPYGWQKTYEPASLLNGTKITQGDVYTFTYSFTSNVAIDQLQVVLVDNCEATSWAWNVISDYFVVQQNIAANTVVSGSVTITADGTATNTTPQANRLVFQAGTGTTSRPTLTFTTLRLEKGSGGNNNNNGGNTGGNTGGGTSSNVYVGVVTFNNTVTTSNISNNLGTAKTFISNSTNNVDATALCYAVSKAVTMFGQQGLPTFDNTFIVTFTDGADNRSSSLYVADGKSVTQTGVYNQAKTDLATRPALRSYAIGFTGNEAINQTNMEQLVQNGLYRTASNVSQLNSVFQGIADSVLASSKNVTLQTNVGLFTEAEPKYFRLTITARPDRNSSTGQTTDTIHGKLVYNMGQTGAVPVFTITQPGTYASFDNPITGTVNSGKILLPFTNLKFVRSGTDYFITEINVEVGYDGTTFREDTEDSSTTEDISKTIGVVLVIDCSQSLGTAFSSVQTAANSFIDTLAAR